MAARLTHWSDAPRRQENQIKRNKRFPGCGGRQGRVAGSDVATAVELCWHSGQDQRPLPECFHLAAALRCWDAAAGCQVATLVL